MKQFKSILLGISLFLLHSCNLLDVDTVSSITGDGYWNTKGDVESYMIGIYTKLRDTSNSTLHFEDRGDAFTTGLEGGLLIYGRKTSHRKMVIAGRAITL